MRTRLIAFLAGLIPFLLVCIWWFSVGRHKNPVAVVSPGVSVADGPAAKVIENNSSDSLPTNVSAHNLLLRKGPNFRFYVRWLRGQMARAHRTVNPSFDDPDSFYLDIKTGVLRANIGDIGNYLNSLDSKSSPLKDIKLSGDGDQIKLNATVHKVLPLPVEILGTLSVVPDNRIQIHVTKINVLKIPVKALLGKLQVTVSDLFKGKGMPGVEVNGNDIVLDTQQLLPPPHIRGQLRKVRVANPDLEEVYGDAEKDVIRVEQWRNFIRLSGGTIDFGKLTMHHVDLTMIDISKDAWFDLDLANYQEQLVNGYTRMTPQAGLQIFMPDLREIPQNAANKSINISWIRNRNVPPPAEVTAK
jgi:hypothetical protein